MDSLGLVGRCRICDVPLQWWDQDGWLPGVWINTDALDVNNSGELCEESPDEHHQRIPENVSSFQGEN